MWKNPSLFNITVCSRSLGKNFNFLLLVETWLTYLVRVEHFITDLSFFQKNICTEFNFKSDESKLTTTSKRRIIFLSDHPISKPNASESYDKHLFRFNQGIQHNFNFSDFLHIARLFDNDPFYLVYSNNPWFFSNFSRISWLIRTQLSYSTSEICKTTSKNLLFCRSLCGGVFTNILSVISIYLVLDLKMIPI